MIFYVEGNILESKAQTLVNPVNTCGVMGKGLALEFKRKFPEMYQNYKYYCKTGQFKIGNLFLYKSYKWIVNFPTKKSWMFPSKLEYIELGLKKFVDKYKEFEIKSIAFPKLGCGYGGLNFETQVKPLMEKYLNSLDIDIYLYV